MTSTDSREKPPAYHHGNLRAALLKAAEEELAEKSIEGLSLRSIAKRAGVSHAAPAHHFGDVNGLLTALAAIGFRRFVDMQLARQAQADDEPRARLAASSLGYVDFAMAHPALFRLIFSSGRPDFDNPELCDAASAAFDLLVRNISDVRGADPYQDAQVMNDLMGAWAIAHGLADLLMSGRLKPLLDLPEAEREKRLLDIVRRQLP